MHKSARLVSVAFSHLALLCGVFALPTVGQGAPLTVLNWIPPTSPSIASMAPCNFVAPTCDSTPAKTTGTIPTWLNSDVAIAMVGKDPSVKGTGVTTITTKIVPIVFTGSASGTSYVFDPENNDVCSPQRTPALNMVQASPVFRTNKLLLAGAGGVSLGTYQFGAQFQRANFATYTIKTASNATPASPNYDISLSQVLSNAEENTKHRIAIGTTLISDPLPYSVTGQVLPPALDWCDPLAVIDVNDFDSLLQNQILPALKGSSITPTTLPIFLLGNVVMYDSKVSGFDSTNPQGVGCCILGYHNAYLSLTTGATAGKLQTYIVANYDTTGGTTTKTSTVKSVSYTGAFPTAPNIVALANMVAGWIDNPTTLNPTPSWPSSTFSKTASVLEVAYPQCYPTSPPATPAPLGGNLTTITMPNKFTYSVQDLAFKSWFYNQSTNTSVINQYTLYSMFSNLTAANPSATCPVAGP
jgi:hypothetical protein